MAADSRRLHRRAHRRLRRRLRGRRAVLLVLVQPRRPRGARTGPGERSSLARRDAARDARCDRKPPARLVARGQPPDAEGDRRHRGPPLLREQRDRLHRDPAGAQERRLVGRLRAGRLDDRAAARPQPLPHAAAVAQPEDRRGLSRGADGQAMEQGPDPHGVPQRHLLRAGGVRDRRCGRGVLRRPREGSLARPGGVARGAAAGAIGVRPAQPAGFRAGTTRGGLARDARGRRHLRSPLPTGSAQSTRPAPTTGTRARGSDVPDRLHHLTARGAVRRRARPPGRAAHLHDARREDADRGDAARSSARSTARAIRRARSSRSTRRRARSARWRSPRPDNASPSTCRSTAGGRRGRRSRCSSSRRPCSGRSTRTRPSTSRRPSSGRATGTSIRSRTRIPAGSRSRRRRCSPTTRSSRDSRSISARSRSPTSRTAWASSRGSSRSPRSCSA